jgi:hypothetical protein
MGVMRFVITVLLSRFKHLILGMDRRRNKRVTTVSGEVTGAGSGWKTLILKSDGESGVVHACRQSKLVVL